MFLYLLKNRYQLLPITVKASLWFIICFIIQRSLQFIGMPIFTRIMSIEDYGTYSVFLSWTNLICVFSSLSIYNGVFNKAMIKFEEKRDEYISSVQALTLIIGIIFSLFILLCNKVIEKYTGFSIKIQLLMCIQIMFFPSFQYWTQKQRFFFKYKKLVIITLLNSFLSLALGVILVVLSEDKGFALIFNTVFIQLVINIFLFISLQLKGRCLYNKQFWKWSIFCSLPLIPHYVSEILLGHADRIMINSMCGPAYAGIYNIVYQISMLMTIIRTGINGAYTPWLYIALKNQDYKSIRVATNYISLIMAFLTFFLMLIGPEILKFAAPTSYYEAVIDIPAIMLGCYFIFIYVLFLNVEIYYEQNKYVAIASCLAAFLNIILNIYCIPIWGYLSAGYTTMFSYMLMVILHFLFLIKIKNKYVYIGEIFDTKVLMYSSLILFALCFISLYLYKVTIIRWICILFLLCCFYCKRKTFLNFLYAIKNINQ